MNYNKIKFFLPLLTIAFSSCHSQDTKFVDLGNLSNDFNVASFFEKKLKQTEERLATDPEKLDKKETLKLLDNPFFVKDTLGFFKTNGRFPTDLSLEATNDWMSRNKTPTEIFGYEYKTVAWNEDNDTLAILNSVAFPKTNMTEDKKGNLMFLGVSKTSKMPTDYKKIKEFIVKHCKKLALENDDPNVSYWENENFYYTLTKKDKKEEEILSYDLQGNKNSKWIDVTEIDLAIYTKSYIRKMEDLNIYSPGNLFWKKRPWE